MDNTIPQETPQGKFCNICKQVRPLTEFSKDRNKLQSKCKSCASKLYKVWYQEHKEEKRQYYAQWEQEHKEERLEYHTQRNHAHAEEHRQFAKQYYHEHIEERREYDRQYRRSEHGKQTAKAYEQSERGQAVRKSINHKRRIASHYRRNSFTANQFQDQLERQKHRCYYCHERHLEKDFVWHADHIIPVSKGGTNDISNVVASCPKCNISKGNKLPHEWTDGGRLL